MDDDTLAFECALTLWGKDAQLGMFIEEIGETLTAFNKMHRNYNGGTLADFQEEIVDLEIMIDQIKLIYPCDYETIRRKKMARLWRIIKRFQGDK